MKQPLSKRIWIATLKSVSRMARRKPLAQALIALFSDPIK